MADSEPRVRSEGEAAGAGGRPSDLTVDVSASPRVSPSLPAELSEAQVSASIRARLSSPFGALTRRTKPISRAAHGLRHRMRARADPAAAPPAPAAPAQGDDADLGSFLDRLLGPAPPPQPAAVEAPRPARPAATASVLAPPDTADGVDEKQAGPVPSCPGPFPVRRAGSFISITDGHSDDDDDS